MTHLRKQMIAALQLSGKGERTQQSYVREVRLLAPFYDKSPSLISEQQLQD
jgi:integrase/recombinase XerD